MAYRFPVNVVSVAPALPAGASTPTILAAPGAGSFYLFVGGSLGINRAATGIADLVVQDGAGNALAAATGLQVGGTTSVPLVIPEPGIALDDNSAIILSISSSAAAGNARVILYYRNMTSR